MPQPRAVARTGGHPIRRLYGELPRRGYATGGGNAAALPAMYRYAPGSIPAGMPLAMPSLGQIQEWADTCERFANRGRHVARKWHRGVPGQTLLNTLLTPNSPRDNCSIHCLDWCDPDGPGLYAARSRHAGLVNAALCDGSVRTVSDAIDPITWHRLGSRNDGGPVADF